MTYTAEPIIPCFCLRSIEPEEREPGSHHAVTCQQYRPGFVGPDAKHWAEKCRELFRLRDEKGVAR